MNKALGWAVASVLMSAIAPIFGKFALNDFSSLTASCFNFVFCLLSSLLWGKFILREKLPSIKRDMIFSSLFYALGIFCLFKSLEVTSPETLSLIGRSYLIWGVLLSWFFFKESFDLQKILGMILIIVGLIFFSMRKEFVLEGVMWALLYGVAFAANNFFIKRVRSQLQSWSIIFYNNLIPGIGGLFFILTKYFNNQFDMYHHNILNLVLYAFLGSFLSILFFYEALEKLEFTTAIFLRGTLPVVSALCSYLVFPIDYTVLNFVGAVLSLVGIWPLVKKDE